MVAFAVGTFFFSLVGIVSLFSLKRYEVARGLVLWAPYRAQADDYARALKHAAISLEQEMVTWPPKGNLICRYFIHRAALASARGFNAAEQWAHRLADRVSHRHGFERRETRSRFLKEVSNGVGKRSAQELEKSEE
ncbi:hypothetical protein EBR66_01320 [bacterium]|nr:hypothetical protein [bacterium]